jgi:NTP pyrophosphatase (non-canonical NTP hydrolase)
MADRTIEDLTASVRDFAHARSWEQFHTPKNLAMALAGEVGELVAIFQWLTAEQAASLDHAARDAAQDELGDVLIYLVRLADVLGIDLLEAGAEKLRKNGARYSVDEFQGSARKAPHIAGPGDERDPGGSE